MKNTGYFERTPTMVFGLQKMKIGKKTKQVPVIKRYWEKEMSVVSINERILIFKKPDAMPIFGLKVTVDAVQVDGYYELWRVKRFYHFNK